MRVLFTDASIIGDPDVCEFCGEGGGKIEKYQTRLSDGTDPRDAYAHADCLAYYSTPEKPILPTGLVSMILCADGEGGFDVQPVDHAN
jgi:hypothetical protein